jgi:hypothetical protein
LAIQLFCAPDIYLDCVSKPIFTKRQTVKPPFQKDNKHQMKKIVETIALINADKNANYSIVTCSNETLLISKGLKKAQLFLEGKLPGEFIEFYSNALGLTLVTTKKTKYYDKEHDFDQFFSLTAAFDKFKPNPERILEKPKDYIKAKKSYPCSRYFPLEYSDHENFNEITRQKVLVPILGTSNSITVDFYENNERGYTLKYLDARNSTLYSLDLSLTNFLSYYIYFGTANYWFFPFITSEKLMVTDLSELKGFFGKLETHQEKILELEKLMKPHLFK